MSLMLQHQTIGLNKRRCLTIETGVNIFVYSCTNVLDEFMKIGHPVDKLEPFGEFFLSFLEKKIKNNEKYRIFMKKGPNLMSFAFNRWGRV